MRGKDKGRRQLVLGFLSLTLTLTQYANVLRILQIC